MHVHTASPPLIQPVASEPRRIVTSLGLGAKGEDPALIANLSEEGTKALRDEDPRVPQEANGADAEVGKTKTNQELTSEEQEQVNALRARDTEVRAHEAAHVAAARGLAGSPGYTFQTGPDGKQYAVGGEVSIDTSPGRTPEETIEKARAVQAAALAPAEPSGQDQQVAAKAASMEAEARLDQAKEEEEIGSSDSAGKKSDSDESVSDAEATAGEDAAPEAESAPPHPEAKEQSPSLGQAAAYTDGGHLHLGSSCAACTPRRVA